MLPSIERLRELFDYDPETGVLTHRDRSREEFSKTRFWRVWQTRYAGKPAGWLDKKGYRVVTISVDSVKRKAFAHRVAWAMTYERWPLDEIDHRNGDGLDNRISNLREATHSENSQNKAVSAICGTVFDAATPRLKRRFRAYIKVNKKHIWLGSFFTGEEAHAAYLAAKAKLHTFQPVPRR